ncbi:unnamed protein product, partial [Symbiodinium sp. KB8]
MAVHRKRGRQQGTCPARRKKNKKGPDEKVLLDLINSCTDSTVRKDALCEYLKVKVAAATAAKDAELALKDAELAEKDAELAAATAAKGAEMVELKVENKMLHQGLLQVQGLLTSMGLFERVAQLAFGEQKVAGHAEGAFDCTSALEQAVITPEAGPWSMLLKTTIKKCAPAVGKSKNRQKDELVRIWEELSYEVHAYPWYNLNLNLVPALSETGKCVIASFAETLGVQVHHGLDGRKQPFVVGEIGGCRDPPDSPVARDSAVEGSRSRHRDFGLDPASALLLLDHDPQGSAAHAPRERRRGGQGQMVPGSASDIPGGAQKAFSP